MNGDHPATPKVIPVNLLAVVPTGELSRELLCRAIARMERNIQRTSETLVCMQAKLGRQYSELDRQNESSL